MFQQCRALFTDIQLAAYSFVIIRFSGAEGEPHKAPRATEQA